MVKEFTAIEEVHDEVELGIGLERVEQVHNEWRLDVFENLTFSLGLHDQVTLSHEILFKNLHCVYLIVILFLNHINNAK